MNITYYGHSSFLVDWNGTKIIFDPFITGNPLANEVDINSIQVDFIFVSHGHQDHILDVETIATNNPEAILVSNYEITTHFSEKGIKGHALNQGGSVNFVFGTVKYVNAIHSSSFPDGSYAGNPGGFLIWDNQQSLYFSGDTALTMDMKLIPMSCPNLSVAILPIGDTFTMGVNDAIVASEFINCDQIIGCHFNTFPPIMIEASEAVSKFNNANKKLILMNIGETIEV